MATAGEYDEAAARIRLHPLGVGGARDDRELIRLAILAASSNNTQPWKFRLRGQEIAILPDYGPLAPYSLRRPLEEVIVA